MGTVDATVLSSLREVVAGDVLSPGDSAFASARAAAIWNGAISRLPAAIVRVSSTEDVAAVVRVARHHHVDVTVRGGGHAFAGTAVADGAVMIDLSRLDNAMVDPTRKLLRCGGGASWGVVDAATAEHGLAITGGFISHTGVAGLTLGGGFGWLTRAFGMTCDSLVSATVVTADGRVVTASSTENPDLHWALRGGGGNFGIVTEFEFLLHDLPPMANLGMFFWPSSDAKPAVQLARTYLHDVPRDVGGLIAGITAPPAPFVPPEHQGKPGFAVLLAGFRSPEEHAELIAPLRQLHPAFELVTPIPYTELQKMQNDSAPWGSFGYEKALYLDDLDDDTIDLLTTGIDRAASPLSFMPIFPLGGAFADMGDEDSAFGGPRSSRWIVNIAGMAPDRALYDADRDWARDLWSQLRPKARDDAGYLNFLADADEARVRASFGESKYRRLAAIKQVWDPDNVFCHNANIRPHVTMPAQDTVEPVPSRPV